MSHSFDAFGRPIQLRDESVEFSRTIAPEDSDSWDFDDVTTVLDMQSEPPQQRLGDADLFPLPNNLPARSPTRTSPGQRRKSSGSVAMARRRSDGSHEVRDLSTGGKSDPPPFKIRFSLRGHLDVIRSVIFTGGGSPAEPEICTAGDDGCIKRWIIPSSYSNFSPAPPQQHNQGGDLDIQSYFTHRGHEGSITCLAASPSLSPSFSTGGRAVGDGWVFSGGQDATVRVWERGRVDPKATTQRPTSLSPSPPPTKPTKDQSKPNPLALANAQIAALKASLKRNDLSNTTSTSHETPRSALEAMIPATAIRGRRRKPGTGPGTSTGISMDEQDALDEFKAFRRKLEGVVASSSAAADAGMGVDDDAEMDGSTNLNDDMVTAAISKDKDIKSTTTQTPAQHPNPPSAATGPPNVVVDEDEEALLCDLHFIAYCQSCRKWDLDDLDPQPETQAGNGSDDGGGDTNGTKNGPHSSSTRGGGAGGGGRSQDNGSIFGHQLSFAKDRLGKNLEWKRQNERELVVIDPREKEREIKGERKARREEGRERERVKEGVKRVGQVGGRW